MICLMFLGCRFLLLTTTIPIFNHAIYNIVMLLAHTAQYCLLGTFLVTTNLLLRPVSNAPSTLYGYLDTSFEFAPFTSRSVCATLPSHFDIFSTARMITRFAFRTVCYTHSALNDTVLTFGNRALASRSHAFIASGCCCARCGWTKHWLLLQRWCLFHDISNRLLLIW